MLTFDYQREPIVVADLVLCAPVVAREARAQRKSLEAHYAHLLVHGTLHAQGFDHERAADAQKMQARESRAAGRARALPTPTAGVGAQVALAPEERAQPEADQRHHADRDPDAGGARGSAAWRRSSCRRSR